MPERPPIHRPAGYKPPQQKRREYDRARDSSSQRGYTYRWHKARLVYLSQYPLCVRCQADGRMTKATDLDHVVPHRGDEQVFWDVSNWQGLCKSCHSRKTATEDGGGWR